MTAPGVTASTLDRVLRPRAVAVLGASSRPGAHSNSASHSAKVTLPSVTGVSDRVAT